MAAPHKTLVILAYAALEWVLILMLLLNSLFSYLIRKFATYYALKPPCFWCSTIDHLLEPNKNKNPYRNLICEPHATEFLNYYYGLDRPKVISEAWCSSCNMNFQAKSVDRSFSNASKIKADYEKSDMIEIMELPIENTSSRHIQVFDQIIPLEWTDSSTSCSRSSSPYGDEGQVENIGKTCLLDAFSNGMQLSGCEEEGDEEKVVTIDCLQEELKAERLVVCGLYIELDKERNASAIAANQAMAMITKLHEEKMALQIESVQNQRMMDEQAEYDQEVLQLLNELVMKLENDKVELENELEMYKDKFLDHDGKKSVKMMPRCHGGSSSITKESLDDKSISDLNNMKALEESIVEFQAERLWILDELKGLDKTLMTLTNDLDKEFEGKTSLEGEDVGYKGNRLLHVFDMKGIGEEVEASHSAWSRCSF